jgi:hypothetical protein
MAGDYAAFEQVLEQAREQVEMRLLSFCVMPNHVLGFVAAGGRESFDVPVLAHQHPYPPLALGAQDGGDRAVVPGTIQVVSRSGRRTLLHRLPLRGTERPACQLGGFC